MNIKLWGILVVILLALGGTSYFLSRVNSGGAEHEDLSPEAPAPVTQQQPKIKEATKEPGRVVVLHTTRGVIEFVMYEKDCPVTTARIAKLVQSGSYNGIDFPRVENWVIQTAPAKDKVDPMGLELAKGLTHEKGTVGMARTNDPNSNTSIFYITLQPAHHLDLQYTNFGRVIKGMDVAAKIKVGDLINKAEIRRLTDADKLELQTLYKQ